MCKLLEIKKFFHNVILLDSKYLGSIPETMSGIFSNHVRIMVSYAKQCPCLKPFKLVIFIKDLMKEEGVLELLVIGKLEKYEVAFC